MTTTSAAETGVGSAAPSQKRHDDAIVGAALRARLTDASFGGFVEPQSIGHR